MNFTFVILHYQVYNDTDECIQSIINNLEYPQINIVVVDNASFNNSGDLLQEKYQTHENIYFIRNSENLGFAKGNNVGFMFAKKELNADFIVLINNDTLIEQTSFIEGILEIYEETKFNILGPDILSTKDGLHQNPLLLTPLSEEKINSAIKSYGKQIVVNKLGCEELALKVYNSIKRMLGKNTAPVYNKDKWLQQHEGVVLHGACMIFDPVYVKAYAGLYSNTFMYMEEYILNYIAEQENLKIIYSPDIQILHKEDSSTNSVYKKESKKRLFVYENSRKSLMELQKVITGGDYYKKYIVDHDASQ